MKNVIQSAPPRRALYRVRFLLVPASQGCYRAAVTDAGAGLVQERKAEVQSAVPAVRPLDLDFRRVACRSGATTTNFGADIHRQTGLYDANGSEQCCLNVRTLST